jgi:hypothetical protein
MIKCCSFLVRMRNISDTICRENQNTIYVQQLFFFSKIWRLWNNVATCCSKTQSICCLNGTRHFLKYSVPCILYDIRHLSNTNQMHSFYCVHTVDLYLSHVSTLVHQNNYARYLTIQLLLPHCYEWVQLYLFDQVTGIDVRPDVADTRQMYVYNRCCAFSWY